MIYPYAEFLLDFDRKYGAYRHRARAGNTSAAVIVESRPLYFLPKVIRNVMYFLGERWNLHVVTGEKSDEFVRRELVGWDVNVLKMNNVHALAIEAYNGLLTSAAFWDLFREEKLLVFQSDCILCGREIGRFMEFDFIGAPAGPDLSRFWINGGLSLRTRRKMIECLRVARTEGEPEDAYFTRVLRDSANAKLPDIDTAARFALESVYADDIQPLGVHGTDKCYHPLAVAQRVCAAIEY